MALTGIMQRFLGAIQVARFMRKVQSLTAATTQTQAAATAMTAANCVITICANSGDGAKLPPIQQGVEIVVTNQGAQTARIYSFETTGVTIGTTAGATGITLAANKTAILFASLSTRWDELLSA